MKNKDTKHSRSGSQDTNSSSWETFEGSSFKDFVMQSFGGSSSTTAQKNLPTEVKSSSSDSKSPQIDLQATFLDSILPAPPSFPAQSEIHNQQRDPWDFTEAAEAAGEQWEHFSPLSFDSNFTNWGGRAVSKPSFGRRNAPRKSSPSSVAEI